MLKSTAIQGSTAVSLVVYDTESRVLSVVTHDGKAYPYQGISSEEHEAFLQAKSKGKAWAALRKSHGDVAPTKPAPKPKVESRPAPAPIPPVESEKRELPSPVDAAPFAVTAEDLKQNNWQLSSGDPNNDPILFCKNCGRFFQLSDPIPHQCMKWNLISKGRW